LFSFKENREKISAMLPIISTFTVALWAESARLKQTKTSCGYPHKAERFTQHISSFSRERALAVHHMFISLRHVSFHVT
jgi:hypothetical protein